ncbi:hypothetical protein R5R35_014087 [Gryllus longicercus]|uniref:Uncharacterized protein n=1 Tax=Gryllus longicercus TaxID=2509291 RepID=A0AAN9V7F8_9ORTH
MSEVELQQLQEPSQTPPPQPPPSPASTPPPPSPDGSEIDGVNPPPPASNWSSGGAEEEEEGGETRRKRRKNKQKEGECTSQCDLHCKTKPKRIRKRRSSVNRKPTDKRRVIRGRQQKSSLTGEAAGVNVTQCARNAAEWLARAVFTLCDENKNNSDIEKYMSDEMYLP